MASMRPFLYIALAVVCFFLWQAWTDFKNPTLVLDQQSPVTNPASTAGDNASAGIPAPRAESADTAGVPTPRSEGQPAAAGASDALVDNPRELIEVVTDKLRVKIDPLGAEIVSATLRDYRVTADKEFPKVELFQRDGQSIYVAQSGLVSPDVEAPNHTSLYRPEAMRYELTNGQDELTVRLFWEEGGLRVTRSYTFARDSYQITHRQSVENLGGMPLRIGQYAQLVRSERPEGEGGFSFTNPENYAFYGAAVYSEALGFEKFAFDEIADSPFDSREQGGWAAMIQHYFLSAWIPPQAQTLHYETARLGGAKDRYLVRWLDPQVSVATANSHEFSSTLYVGPKEQDRLEQVAPGLPLAVDYGFFTVFSEPLFWVLKSIHSVIGNWGWSIILLTVLVKLVFYKLTEAQYRSMARMRKIQPRMMSLRERYADDRAKLSEAMMKLYKEEKVNPLGGCLPVLVQIPIFMALYWVLLESVELRQASFMFWLQDLSSPDPYYILPLIMGVAAWTQQKLNPMVSNDPMQQRVMQALPIVMAVMFAFFQAGLVLYWTTNQLLGLAQQYYITKKLEREGK
jgi:YidC/Oxa1 family membrane protein insertase